MTFKISTPGYFVLLVMLFLFFFFTPLVEKWRHLIDRNVRSCLLLLMTRLVSSHFSNFHIASVLVFSHLNMHLTSSIPPQWVSSPHPHTRFTSDVVTMATSPDSPPLKILVPFFCVHVVLYFCLFPSLQGVVHVCAAVFVLSNRLLAYVCTI